MRNKFLFLFVLFIAAGAVVYGVDKAEELKRLENQRKELTWKIVDKRAEIIASNPDLKQLHDQIMAMHREMALKLDANPEMQKLNEQAEKLDQQIAALKNNN